MRILLDTHALLWMLSDNPRLTRRASIVIDDQTNEILVSAASAYEVCLKHALGKLRNVDALAAAFEDAVLQARCTPLPITIAHAVAAAGLPMTHKDPFDRLLIAQAIVERVPLISNETLFDGFGVDRLW